MNKSKLLLGIIIALILVMGATVLLNGGISTEVEEVNNTSTNETSNQTQTSQTTVIGNNSMGTVSKISSFGNKTSDIRIALIIGIDEEARNNTIIPTMESKQNLKYSYDIYVVNVTSSNSENSSESSNSSGLSFNEKSETLANEFVVQDVINNKYNATIDIHSSEGSNSYMFTPVEEAVISQDIIDKISNKTNIGIYKPEQVSYLSTVSIPIVNSPMVEIEYHAASYYGSTISEEISAFIDALDNYDFNADVENSNNTTDNQTNTNESANNYESNSSNGYSNETYNSSQ
ncbi:MAG: hypothetical protein E7Z84_04285 [Methanosphaera stadtmanae]|jgi:hypothetical protein|nr:hypothetical protein [Methanosphaera stadtmanae]